MPELIQERIFGAVRFMDGTTLMKVDGNLTVQAANAVVRRNRSNLYVIWEAPANGTVVFTVSDPSGNYLARQFSVQLPRDTNPAPPDLGSPIFQTVDVNLLPSPVASTSPGWATIRARVTKAGTNTELGGALIRVTRTSDQFLLATGMSDARGEALVCVPGVPVTTFDSGTGAVMATSIDVNIQTIFDPALTGIPNPDDLDARKNTLPSSTVTDSLTSGKLLKKELSVTLP